ncbi:group II intron reverse transcriptase/maturase [Desulfatitalea tepidiphila]|uniref:group II intron reverse transcriptase/maturase n=1 Tax=Desulfatitalea tepidiphila TaxID=1185843 RepID=UPI0006B63991|nr:group II intron reverse transcriptase/maturase [Desulfatitalea tepidiphila]
MKPVKPFDIPKILLWEAFQDVKANGGAAGVDDESIEMFEANLKDNLYRLWNRMSSGSYFPPPVKAVPIPKKSGGTRVLGVPTVGDRIAQAVVKGVIEPILDPIFDENSFGYRPGKSAHDAVDVTRQRCWRYDWVVEFDIKGLFDNIDHALLMKALRYHCKIRWVLLYVERWLKAPLQNGNGEITARTVGTPQGGVVSPLLANLFLHYAFDAWVRRTLPTVPFCRYADDGLLHCKSRRQAQYVMAVIDRRFKDCGLEMHPEKSRIIYCKDAKRSEAHEIISFDFLGFTFRPRRCVSKVHGIHPNFLPAISRQSMKSVNREVRSWHMQLKNDKSLKDLSKMFNPKLQGWYAYYGRFYSSAMYRIWRNINEYLVRWLRRRYKRLASHRTRAWQYLRKLAKQNQRLFIHWKLGCLP